MLAELRDMPRGCKFEQNCPPENMRKDTPRAAKCTRCRSCRFLTVLPESGYGLVQTVWQLAAKQNRMPLLEQAGEGNVLVPGLQPSDGSAQQSVSLELPVSSLAAPWPTNVSGMDMMVSGGRIEVSEPYSDQNSPSSGAESAPSPAHVDPQDIDMLLDSFTVASTTASEAVATAASWEISDSFVQELMGSQTFPDNMN